MKKVVLFLLLVFAGHFVTYAQEDAVSQKLDVYLSAANKVNKFNGNALVAERGKILLQKSYGKKNFISGVNNDANTVFQIGSVTKQFTAAVVMKLQEEGKLSVHDTLSKYFPSVEYAKKITLENLLTHTSGLYDYVADIDDEDSAIACHPIDKQLVLDLIFKHDLYFEPGTEYRYCNSGYYLLGLIIEKVSGKSYEQNVRDIIFTPLQMNHSFFDFRNSADTNIATGYQEITNTYQNEATAWRWDSTVSFAAGAIYSTTTDMYKWVQAIAQKKILTAASWKAMLTPHLNNYGYGINVDTIFRKSAYTHGGGIPGFISYLCYFPADDVTIILLCNQGWFGDALNVTNADLGGIVFHKNIQPMHDVAGKQLSSDSLKKYVGTYEFDKKHHAYITLEDGQLQMEAPEGGLPKSPLFAEDDSNFYLKIINARIEFVRDASGNITTLIAHYAGKSEVCKKIK